MSSDSQDVESQKIGIVEFLKQRELEAGEWVADEGVSGAVDWRKRGIGRIIAKAKPGDTLVFSEISRIARRLVLVLEVIKACSEKGVKIYTVKDRYVLEDTIQSKVLITVMGLAAEIERDLLRQRTREGLKRAVANGKTLGRPRGAKTDPALRKLHGSEDRIVQLRGRGVSFNGVARLLKVHRNTLARYIRENLDAETRDIIGFGQKSKAREGGAE
ncbi:MAG: recombinase family protein [Kiritimatiellae bacterium]|nr:recombinase family protein [Kiritimatiellia bacterium]